VKESGAGLVLEDVLKNLPRFSPVVLALESADRLAAWAEKASSGSIVPVQYDKHGDSLKIVLARFRPVFLVEAPS
jgi:hypothetical protein